MNNWPKDDRASLEAFYGTHELDMAGKPTAHWEEANLTFLSPPWKMFLSWDPTQRVRVIKCHKAVVDSLARVLDTLWKHYANQIAIEQAGLHLWGGCYEFRRVSGSDSLSTHAWGAGVDIDPARNPRGLPWKDKTGMMPLFVIAAFKAEGWEWGGHFRTPDAMHFQATSSQALAPAVAGLAVAPVAPSAASVAPSGPSMTDAINLTKGMTLPPIGQTQGPDGSMTQLEGDIRHWLQYRATGMDRETYSTKFGVVAGRIRRLYPQFLLWGVRSMLLARGLSMGNPSLSWAWERFGGASGPVMATALREYLVDWGVTP